MAISRCIGKYLIWGLKRPEERLSSRHISWYSTIVCEMMLDFADISYLAFTRYLFHKVPLNCEQNEMLKTLRRLSSICGERNIDHISDFQHLLMFSYLNIKCTIAKGVIMVMERKKRFGKRTCHKSRCLFQCCGAMHK